MHHKGVKRLTVEGNCRNSALSEVCNGDHAAEDDMLDASSSSRIDDDSAELLLVWPAGLIHSLS
jgi:hypothetical protein